MTRGRPARQGQVLVEVEAVGANVIDTVFRAGTGPWRRSLPGTLSGDVVGRVAALGPNVTNAAVGDRVAALSEDAFADYVTADAKWLAPASADVDAGEATVLSMTAPLALRLLRAGQLANGDTVLVQAAAGGVGHLALQLARILGAKTVIGVASSPAKLEFVRRYGADEAIDSSDPGWPEHVRAAAPAGVDMVLDAVGGHVFDQGLELLAPLGRMVTYGAVSGALPTVQARSLFALKDVRHDRGRPGTGTQDGYARRSTPRFPSRTPSTSIGHSKVARPSAGWSRSSDPNTRVWCRRARPLLALFATGCSRHASVPGRDRRHVHLDMGSSSSVRGRCVVVRCRHGCVRGTAVGRLDTPAVPAGSDGNRRQNMSTVITHEVPVDGPAAGVHTFVTGGLDAVLTRAHAVAFDEGVTVRGGATGLEP